MRLRNMKKGQFVYYKNELHRVYAIKKFLKQSVHLLRLRDLKQKLTTSNEVMLYHPQEGDSFFFNENRYTLQRSMKPEIGDLVLIVKPRPDYLDHYGLNEIAKVSKVENKDIVTYKGNGIKNHEYMLMSYDPDKTGRDMTYLMSEAKIERTLVGDEERNTSEEELLYGVTYAPRVGDIFTDATDEIITMIVAIKSQTVYLGDGTQIEMKDLLKSPSWKKI